MKGFISCLVDRVDGQKREKQRGRTRENGRESSGDVDVMR